MAKRKKSSKRPQPRHKKQKKSQHDKRQRLGRRNPARRRTTKAKVPLAGAMQTAVAALQAVMDRRIAFRLAIIVAGMGTAHLENLRKSNCSIRLTEASGGGEFQLTTGSPPPASFLGASTVQNARKTHMPDVSANLVGIEYRAKSVGSHALQSRGNCPSFEPWIDALVDTALSPSAEALVATRVVRLSA